MSDRNEAQGGDSGQLPDDLDRALTSSADVASAGRSCVVIIALAIGILVLLAVWVLYTT